jgi:hypothetical protein
MQARDIRDKIVPLIEDLLGTYKPVNTPAVSVGTIPTGWTPIGLELYIRKFPSRRIARGAGKVVVELWEFQLNQFGEGNQIYEAAKIIQSKLAPSPQVYYVEAPNKPRMEDLTIVPSVYFKWAVMESVDQRVYI